MYIFADLISSDNNAVSNFMVRLVDAPHRAVLKMVGFEDAELSRTAGFPTSKRQLLDRLQMKLTVFNDRIEVNGLFPIEPIGVQLCAYTRGRG